MIAINTESLQQHHPDVYKNFYAEYDLVVSIPNVIRRRPSSSKSKSSIHIRQKVPTRIYLWVNRKCGDWDMLLWSCTFFNAATQEFNVLKQDDLLSPMKFDALKKSFMRSLYKYDMEGCWEIGILGEQKRWYGFGFMGSLCTLLSSAIVVCRDSTTVTYNEEKILKEAYDISIHCDLGWWWWPSWLSPRVELFKWYDAWVQVWGLYTHPKEARERQRTLSDMIWEISRLDVFDYWVLTLGFPYKSHDLKQKVTTLKKQKETLYDYFNGLLTSSWLIQEWDTSYTDDMHQDSLISKVKVIKALSNVSWDPCDTNTLNDFLMALWTVGLVEWSSQFDNRSLYSIYRLFDASKISQEDKIWIVPISIWDTWWTFFFMMIKNKNRDALETIKWLLHDKWYTNTFFPYLSWRDGHSDVWLRVDQHLDQWIFWEYVSKTSVFFESQGVRVITQHSDALAAETDNLILDNIHKKVHYKWEKLTHKHLRSQSATVEIVTVLIEAQWASVHNTDFPISSYSKNKNEMIGKIIQPLELFMESIWYSLTIKCTWTLHDFYLILEEWEEYFDVISSVL